MSRRHSVQSADGVVANSQPFGNIIKTGVGAPTNGQVGDAPGCLYVNVTGTAGTVLYVNQGTKTSSTWLAIA